MDGESAADRDEVSGERDESGKDRGGQADEMNPEVDSKFEVKVMLDERNGP